FRKPGSEWFSGDLYIFSYAPDGTVLLNPAFPAREGNNYHGEKDRKGKAFHDELQNVARTKGSGWVDYWLPKPGQTEPSHRWSYVRRAKADGGLLVGPGFFPEGSDPFASRYRVTQTKRTRPNDGFGSPSAVQGIEKTSIQCPSLSLHRHVF